MGRLHGNPREVHMQIQVHPLEPFFRHAVLSSFGEKLGLNDPELTGYLAHMLCEFSEPGNLNKAREQMTRPLVELEALIRASDPVRGIAPSFDAERALRKSIGDYALFVAGMYHEATESGDRHRPSLGYLIQAGKESYFIVSQFNLFEYEDEAPLFGRLAEGFERCILGLALLREELGAQNPFLPLKKGF
jgi:hypothetical protein